MLFDGPNRRDLPIDPESLLQRLLGDITTPGDFHQMPEPFSGRNLPRPTPIRNVKITPPPAPPKKKE
jgi:hypothetical protein